MPAGTLELKKRLDVTRSSVVLRGAGRGKTTLNIPKSALSCASLLHAAACCCCIFCYCCLLLAVDGGGRGGKPAHSQSLAHAAAASAVSAHAPWRTQHAHPLGPFLAALQA
jgi:hypothetical protein